MTLKLYLFLPWFPLSVFGVKIRLKQSNRINHTPGSNTFSVNIFSDSWTPRKSKRNWLYCQLEYVVTRCVVVDCMYSILIGLPMKIYLESNNRQNIFSLLFGIFIQFMTIAKIVAVVNKGNIEKLCYKLDRIYSFKCWDDKQKRINQRTRKICDFITKYWRIFALFMATSVLLASIPDMISTRSTPIM